MASQTSESSENVQPTIEHVDELQDHWWWRQGWRTGRHFYACHITLRNHPELQTLVGTYQQAIKDIDGLDPIPTEWLHLTMQGVGFVDEIDDQELARVVDEVQRQIRGVPIPTVSFHRPVVRPEAVYLPGLPAEPVRALRSAVRDGIAQALGADRVHEASEKIQGYRPHVSIAYSNRQQPAQPIVDALARIQAEPVTAVISEIALLEFHRDRRMYEWTSATPLGIASSRAEKGAIAR